MQAAKPHFPNTEPPFDHISCFDVRVVVGPTLFQPGSVGSILG